MNLWDTEGIPHRGWKYDIENPIIDVAGEDPGNYQTCEMCGNERVRYIHVMTHPDFSRPLHVGCICAEKMTQDYTNPRRYEANFKNKQKRKITFMKKEWTRNRKGNSVIKYKGKIITIMQSRYNTWQYGVIFDGKGYWKNQKTNLPLSYEDAKQLSFELVDATVHS